MGFSDANVYHTQLTTESVNSAMFASFISQLPFPRNTVLLLDNASIHHSKVVKESMRLKGYEPLFVPPYSPELNPIELLFGLGKNAYRKDRMRHPNVKLTDCITQVIERVSVAPSLTNCFRHVDGVVDRVIANMALVPLNAP
jgi:transposase